MSRGSIGLKSAICPCIGGVVPTLVLRVVSGERTSSVGNNREQKTRCKDRHLSNGDQEECTRKGVRWKAWVAAFRVYSLGAPLIFLNFPPPRENQKITTSDLNGREISRLPVILAMAPVFCPVGSEFSLIVLVFGTGESSNRRGHSTAEQRAETATLPRITHCRRASQKNKAEAYTGIRRIQRAEGEYQRQGRKEGNKDGRISAGDAIPRFTSRQQAKTSSAERRVVPRPLPTHRSVAVHRHVGE